MVAMSRTVVRRKSVLGAAGVGLAALGGALLTPAPAQSAADPACPEPVPVSELVAGQAVDGLTVSSGTTPDDFTGEVVGVLEDGIAPGLDMIVMKMSGSVITDPDTGEVDRGIWAGMSGSPVYAEDGRLIGAVSYSLAYSPSEYAGVTPAEDMYAILDHTEAAPGDMAKRVGLDRALTKTLSADDDLSAKAVAGGFRRLRMPWNVSGGMTTEQIRRVAREGGMRAQRYHSGLGARAGAAPVPIQAGGNLAATASYGDITLSGTGTATAVCGDDILGFGHPMLFSGTSDLTIHGATALYIERDLFSGSYKISQPGGPAGSLVQDRFAGILGIEGALPPTTTIQSNLRSASMSRLGTTSVSDMDYLGYVTALHTYANLLRIGDQDGPGSTNLAWTISLTGEDGRSLVMQRSSKFASSYSAADESVYSLWDDVERITGNRFEDVTINSVDITGSITDELRELRIGKVERFGGGRWSTVDRRDNIRARAGSTLKLRVTLNPTSGSDAVRQRLRLDLAVPSKPGSADVRIGGYGYDPNRAGATSLDELIGQMSAAPGNDDVSVSLTTNRRPRTMSTDRAGAAAAVQGYVFLNVRIVR